MDKVLVNQTGGFPLTTNILNSLQKAYSIFNSFGELAGNYSIISGCEEIGSTVSKGIIYVNGEVFDFKGGLKTSNIVLNQKIESKQFEDGSIKDVVFERFYEFGSAVENIPWSKFERFEGLVSLTKKVVKIVSDLTSLVTRLVILENKPDNTVLPASQLEVDSRSRTDKYVSPATLPDYTEVILLTAEIAKNGTKINDFKRTIYSKRISQGLYEINHNLGIKNYGVVGSGVNTRNIKVSMLKRDFNYCVLGVSDDSSVNDEDFSFIMFKI